MLRYDYEQLSEGESKPESINEAEVPTYEASPTPILETTEPVVVDNEVKQIWRGWIVGKSTELKQDGFGDAVTDVLRAL